MGVIIVRVNTGDIHGISKPEVLEGIKLGFGMWGNRTAAEFEFSYSGGWDYRIDSKVIYLGRNSGGHSHGRGLANINGNRMWLHSGYIPGHQGNRNGESYWWAPYTSPLGLGKIVAHEFGHNLGLRHSNSKSCIMHSNASAKDLCTSEIAYGQRKLGKPGPPKVYLKPGDTVDTLNVVEIERGSYVVDGKRHWLTGDQLVVYGGKVIVHRPTPPRIALKTTTVEIACCSEVV